MSKYRSVRSQASDGTWFASKAECRRYEELRLLERAGEIRQLQIQPRFPIVIDGVKVCTYVADFAYVDRDKRTVEDVKGVRTPLYRLKKKLAEAVYPGLRIVEVP